MISRLRRREAAAYLHIGLSKLDGLRKEGKIVPVVDCGTVFYEAQELDRYHESLKAAQRARASIPFETFRKRRKIS